MKWYKSKFFHDKIFIYLKLKRKKKMLHICTSIKKKMTHFLFLRFLRASLRNGKVSLHGIFNPIDPGIHPWLPLPLRTLTLRIETNNPRTILTYLPRVSFLYFSLIVNFIFSVSLIFIYLLSYFFHFIFLSFFIHFRFTYVPRFIILFIINNLYNMSALSNYHAIIYTYASSVFFSVSPWQKFFSIFLLTSFVVTLISKYMRL